MKKIGIIALILVLTVSLCACGRNNNGPMTEDPTSSTPAPSITPNVPDPEPTMDTNIPDPEVDPNSTAPGGMATDPGSSDQGSTGAQSNGIGSETDDTGSQSGNNDTARSRMRKMK